MLVVVVVVVVVVGVRVEDRTQPRLPKPCGRPGWIKSSGFVSSLPSSAHTHSILTWPECCNTRQRALVVCRPEQFF